jgi:plasmid stabilization system protein ParE
MKGVVRWRFKARQDLIDIFRNLAREAGLTTAGKFLVQAKATFARLSDTPTIGTRYEAEGLLSTCRSTMA